MKGKTKILWLSRHTMTKEQVDDLHEIYGDIEIKRYQQTIKNYREVIKLGADCDVFAVVLPIAIIADLVSNVNKPVIRAKTTRVPTGCVYVNGYGNEEMEYRFQHNGWEQVKNIQVETVNLLERKECHE
jgi:hypothetical protein